MKEITVDSAIDNVSKVTEFADLYLEEHNCPIKVQMQIDIAIDEIFSNIAYYAYDGKTGTITVKISFVESKYFELSFIDNGKQYDPLKKEDPDVTLSAEERGIGGLGIFIVKKSMDNLNYEYINNQNILTIRKNIN